MAVFEIKRTDAGLSAFVGGHDVGQKVDAMMFQSSPHLSTELAGKFGTAVTHVSAAETVDVINVAEQLLPVASLDA